MTTFLQFDTLQIIAALIFIGGLVLIIREFIINEKYYKNSIKEHEEILNRTKKFHTKNLNKMIRDYYFRKIIEETSYQELKDLHNELEKICNLSNIKISDD